MNNKPDIIQWSDMPYDMQLTILNSHVRNYNNLITIETLRKIFNQANPLMYCGFEKGKPYTQIHETSAPYITTLIKQNL